MCVETKLLDALFEAALAPYNRQLFERGPNLPGPFDTEVSAELPGATQKYIYVCIQRICSDNEVGLLWGDVLYENLISLLCHLSFLYFNTGLLLGCYGLLRSLELSRVAVWGYSRNGILV